MWKTIILALCYGYEEHDVTPRWGDSGYLVTGVL